MLELDRSIRGYADDRLFRRKADLAVTGNRKGKLTALLHHIDIKYVGSTIH